MVKKSTKEECPPDHLRCSRTDGRQWRCKRRAMENVKLCEVHHLQLQHRQKKVKVPESLKLQRNMKTKKKKQNDVVEVEIRSNKKKKKSKKNDVVDVQLDLIRMVLQREVEKKKNPNKKNVTIVDEELELVKVNYSEGELRKELPNGVMEIAPVSTSHRRDDDDVVDFHCNGKAVVTPPYFRSKNVDRRVPIDNFHVGFFSYFQF